MNLNRDDGFAYVLHTWVPGPSVKVRVNYGSPRSCVPESGLVSLAWDTVLFSMVIM